MIFGKYTCHQGKQHEATQFIAPIGAACKIPFTPAGATAGFSLYMEASFVCEVA